jgi:hypothetical protein
VAEVKLFAPGAIRKDLQRAVTADDYARLAERNPQAQRAAAELRWTGSWYEACVAIDPRGTEEITDEMLWEIEGHLHPYRHAGHDLMVGPALYVPLDIVLRSAFSLTTSVGTSKPRYWIASVIVSCRMAGVDSFTRII